MRIAVQHRQRVYELEAFEHDHVSRAMAIPHKFYEFDLLDAIAAHDREGVYLDVGAFVGSHSVFFKHECRSTAVRAFEPNPLAFAWLRRNAEAHGFRAFHCAISDALQLVTSCDETPGNHGMATVRPGGSVVACPLDALESDTDVAVLKIDAENSEMAVLRGARWLIERCHPLIAAEAQTNEARDTIDAFLTPMAYHRSRRYCKTPTYIWS